MDSKYTRTTITLPENLLFELKKKALMERKTMKEVVNEGLGKYVQIKTPATRKLTLSSLFGTWGKGESGLKFLKRVRYSKMENKRELYLAKLWKKS